MAADEHSIVELAPHGDSLRVVQVTDTHLKAFEGGKLLGLDTDYSLRAVIDLIKREYPNPDLLLGTGDLADSGAPDAYRRLLDYFAEITPQHYWLPGNHDLRDVMEDVAGAERLPGEIRGAGWQIVMLDSQLPGEVGGHLGTREIARLDQALKGGQAAGLDTLLCLHHQPVSIGCDWLDEQMVSDAKAFFELIGDYSRVRGVLWGHVHQALDEQRDDLRLMCTPSTCIQFLPRQVDFALDTRPPGYRWLELRPEGGIATGISRAESQVFPVDMDASGYL